MFNERSWQACYYVTLYDEDDADEQGSREELEWCRKEWVYSSLVPYESNQCRRAWCSSHVEVGGGVALDSHSLKCERASGPSHVVDGGGDALQGISPLSEDGSSPLQSERFRAGVDRHNVDSVSGGF
jgi:hypothetical protein